MKDVKYSPPKRSGLLHSIRHALKYRTFHLLRLRHMSVSKYNCRHNKCFRRSRRTSRRHRHRCCAGYTCICFPRLLFQTNRRSFHPQRVNIYRHRTEDPWRTNIFRQPKCSPYSKKFDRVPGTTLAKLPPAHRVVHKPQEVFLKTLKPVRLRLRPP